MRGRLLHPSGSHRAPSIWFAPASHPSRVSTTCPAAWHTEHRSRATSAGRSNAARSGTSTRPQWPQRQRAWKKWGNLIGGAHRIASNLNI